jgi:hypothetical protein
MRKGSLIENLSLDEKTGCWNWTGGRMKSGYGVMTFRGKPETVHRIAAILWKGFDPSSGLWVLHHCDNPSCFNPKHLFIGNRSDNMKDCISKGRQNNTRKTHCPQGHIYTGQRDILGRRFCKICKDRRRALAIQARKAGSEAQL